VPGPVDKPYPAREGFRICQVDNFHSGFIGCAQDGCWSGARSLHSHGASSSPTGTGAGPFHRGFIAAGQDEGGSVPASPFLPFSHIRCTLQTAQVPGLHRGFIA
jgi:hypothetical protein